MIVTVAKSELARLIERPCKLASKQKESYLACVKLSVSDFGPLVAEATDLNDSVRSVCTASMASEDGEVLVSARILSKVVKSLPEQPVELSGDGDGLRLSCGRSSFDVPSIDPAEFPGLIGRGDVVSVDIETATLASLAARTSYAAKKEKEETVSKKPIMGCVNLKCAGGTVTATATDSYRVARTSCAAPDAPDFEMNVPVRMLADFAKSSCGTVTLFASDTTVGLASDEDEVVGRAFAGKFPDVDRVIAMKPIHRAEFGRGYLLEALKRAAVIDGANNPVVLALDDAGINVSRKSDVESMSELVDAKVDAPVVVALNAAYAVDAVSAIPSAEVVMELQDPNRLVKFSGGGCEAYVMPVRLLHG